MRVALLHASAGHGHTKVAEAIREGLIHSGLSEKDVLLLDVLDEVPRWFGKLYSASYYYSVKHTPHLWGAVYEVADHFPFYQNFGRHCRRWVNGRVGRKLASRVIQEGPDAIIATHFMPPEIFGHAKVVGRFRGQVVTVVTDFLPHTFWVNPGTDHYWIMSEEGEKELQTRGVPEEKITVGGIPVSLKFKPQGRKEEIRRREGFRQDRFTLLITSGSFGLGPTAEILEALVEFGESIQVAAVCGRNEAQYRSLENQRYPFLTKLYRFVSNMDELMEASDLVVAKPGGSTTAEALAKGVPMVVLEPIPGQEMGNARLLKMRNAAFFLGGPRDIRVILKALFDYPEMLQEKKRAIQVLAKPDAALNLARLVLDLTRKKEGKT